MVSSWSTRRSFTCRASGSSPISSRNRVPVLASSNRPRRSALASVNAPLRWPNSSLSSRFSGMAPQLMATNGLLARIERRWMARATSSLPTPRLAHHEHRGLVVGDLPDGAEQLHHGSALGEDLVELVLGADRLPKLQVLAPQRLALLGLLEHEEDLVGLERLRDVVVGAGLHRLEGEVDRAVGAHHDHHCERRLRLERGEQVEPAHLRHAHVGQDHVRTERLHALERLFTGAGRLDLVTGTPEKRAQHQPEVFLVVDDQDAAHGYANISRPIVRERKCPATTIAQPSSFFIGFFLARCAHRRGPWGRGADRDP